MIRRYSRQVGRVASAAVFVSLMFTGSPSQAQSEVFGRNKVSYGGFEWRSVETEHFDIYFYDAMDDIAKVAMVIAEDAYEQISKIYHYELRNRAPILIYRSHNAFTQTHTSPQILTEGTKGFTEFLKNRVVIPFEGSYPAFRHVIHHELSHAVFLDMLFGREIAQGIYSTPIPLWWIEGLAEYTSQPWDAESDMWVRDAVVGNEMRLDGYFAYRGGQAIIYYIAETHGPEKIAAILDHLRSSRNFDAAIKSSLGVSLKELGDAWERDLKKVYWPEVARREVADEVAESLTNHQEDFAFFNVSPAFSPHGDKIAFMTGKELYTSIHVMSAIDGKHLWRVVTGEQSGSYEGMHFLRGGITWSPDAQQMAFAAKSGEQDKLYVVDARSGELQREFALDMDGVFGPSWSPKGGRLAFVGVKGARSDLYILDLDDEHLTRLTDDRFDEYSPSWAPDGKFIAFASDRNLDRSDDAMSLLYGNRDIFVVHARTQRVRQITDHPSDDNSPSWSPEGDKLVFTSDRNGIYNLHIVGIGVSGGLPDGESTVRPLTNLLGGAFSPDWSRGGNKIAFAGFRNSGWDIFVLRDPLEKVITDSLSRAFFVDWGHTTFGGPENAGHRPSRTGRRAAPSHTVVAADSAVASDRMMGPIVRPDSREQLSELVSRSAKDSTRFLFNPNRYETDFGVDHIGGQASFSTFGGFGGSMVLQASDLMGYHQVVTAVQLYRDLKDSDFLVMYMYLKHRLNIGGYFSQVNNYYPRTTLFQGQRLNVYDNIRQRSLGGFGSYPLNQYQRVEAGTDIYSYTSFQAVNDDFGSGRPQQTLKAFLPFVAFVHDNSLWGFFGPLTGSRARLDLTITPRQYNTNLFGIAKADVRQYVRTGDLSNVAIRVAGGVSWGRDKQVFYVGGLPQWINFDQAFVVGEEQSNNLFAGFVWPVRGLNYYDLRGSKYAVVNLEYRFPLIWAVIGSFPFTILRNVGGVFFLDMARTWDPPNSQNGGVVFGGAPDRLLGGYGYGMRLNLGVLALKFDVAWQTDLEDTFGDARYYWSLGWDF